MKRNQRPEVLPVGVMQAELLEVGRRLRKMTDYLEGDDRISYMEAEALSNMLAGIAHAASRVHRARALLNHDPEGADALLQQAFALLADRADDPEED